MKIRDPKSAYLVSGIRVGKIIWGLTFLCARKLILSPVGHKESRLSEVFEKAGLIICMKV